ncbi:hypothetical protein IQ270_03785 [Microcoleus sp. LEGE 07076]|uniref:hypothetical protein n=1 Tax=Microcoleus sp. LEGE 07076 TaxID=915322 RepID=UPI001880978B|nr:hypothetical protein [Microcoleus sp. LEGE 07076]MBE9183867.1 hypothetical protein [Microcoleus sp. LEGE 07076]
MNDEYNPSQGEDHPSDRQLLYQELDILVTQICQEISNPWKQRRLLNQLIVKMENSGLIWKEDVPYYEDAVAEQWGFFCSNLWESRTGTQYDRTRSNPITWFNNRLRWRLLTLAQNLAEENGRRCQNEKRLEQLPVEDETHIIECVQFFEIVQSWIETNPDGILNEHIRGRKDLTCQVILSSMLSGKKITQMAAEYGCAYQTIYGFWKNKCRPRLLEKFGKNYGC